LLLILKENEKITQETDKRRKGNETVLLIFVDSTTVPSWIEMYEGWNFNSGNYLFTTDTK